MCNLHWCYTFCTGVTPFALVLHLSCTALSQLESSNFFMYINFVANDFVWITPHVHKYNVPFPAGSLQLGPFFNLVPSPDRAYFYLTKSGNFKMLIGIVELLIL